METRTLIIAFENAHAHRRASPLARRRVYANGARSAFGTARGVLIAVLALILMRSGIIDNVRSGHLSRRSIRTSLVCRVTDGAVRKEKTRCSSKSDSKMLDRNRISVILTVRPQSRQWETTPYCLDDNEPHIDAVKDYIRRSWVKKGFDFGCLYAYFGYCIVKVCIANDDIRMPDVVLTVGLTNKLNHSTSDEKSYARGSFYFFLFLYSISRAKEQASHQRVDESPPPMNTRDLRGITTETLAKESHRPLINIRFQRRRGHPFAPRARNLHCAGTRTMGFCLEITSREWESLSKRAQGRQSPPWCWPYTYSYAIKSIDGYFLECSYAARRQLKLAGPYSVSAVRRRRRIRMKGPERAASGATPVNYSQLSRRYKLGDLKAPRSCPFREVAPLAKFAPR
ncbi:hypothetical protein EVAR_35839_1 [Eumeta japonica]|uniref:Uncharacterized protein n=1 Tax=Eumeta variegata TaxID=151549 RepID=A0A4C1WZU7_EUMVA|nr:hypothetical protein EVAR_35839_1 [Eumeta japonica]